MNVLEQMRADWDRRAREDPYYYVAFARRGQDHGDFLATASENIGAFEAELGRLPPASSAPRRALEIGCGPGRLLLPMSQHFDEIHGVDVSSEMLRLAEETLREIPNAHLHLTEGSDLRMFASSSFEYVYSYAVFQHIPDREVVLSYLREIARVLKPGGVTCCHLRGAPPVQSEQEGSPPTWTGCFFVWDDVRQFVKDNYLQLVAISGIGTQHMLVTMRRPEPHTGTVDVIDRPCLLAVTPAVDCGNSVPRSGRNAAVSLWMDGLPANAGIVDLEVQFNNERTFPCYISP